MGRVLIAVRWSTDQFSGRAHDVGWSTEKNWGAKKTNIPPGKLTWSLTIHPLEDRTQYWVLGFYDVLCQSAREYRQFHRIGGQRTQKRRPLRQRCRRLVVQVEGISHAAGLPVQEELLHSELIIILLTVGSPFSAMDQAMNEGGHRCSRATDTAWSSAAHLTGWG